MEEWQIRLIVGILVGVGSASGGGVLVHKMYAEKVEALSAESRERLLRLQDTEEKLAELAKSHQDLTLKFESLRAKYTVLEEDYRKATTAQGMTYDGPSLDSSWHETEVATGDRLRFKLSSASLYLQVVRITHDGPVIRATGCTPHLVDPAFVSANDGAHAYLLRRERELHLQVSPSGTAAGYLSADLSDLEDIYVLCLSHDVKSQRASLKFRQTLPER